MCHPKAYWKVSLFRTTTGEKFEIRYINVVRGEQEWLLKLYTLPTAYTVAEKKFTLLHISSQRIGMLSFLYFPIFQRGNAFSPFQS